MGPHQSVEQLSRHRRRDSGHRSRCLDVHLRARYQPQAPKHAASRGGQASVGQVEGGWYGAGRVTADREGAEPSRAAQRGHVVGDSVLRTVTEVRRRYPQRQRQVAAQRRQFLDGDPLGPDPASSQQAFQQRRRLLIGQSLQADAVGAVARHQSGESVAAGRHDQRAGSSGHQRADLAGIGRIVEHHQYPAVGEPAAVSGHRLVRVGRDLVAGYP